MDQAGATRGALMKEEATTIRPASLVVIVIIT
jgi:hypothetical protein